MRYKLKVGDRVRLVANKEVTGVIINVDENWIYPYEVKFDNKKRDNALDSLLYSWEDLELIGGTIQNKIEQKYISIKFQDGAVKESGVNGCQIEEVIDALVAKLEGFQKGDFPCRENALAITKLEEARMWLNERTRKRQLQGVEGMSKKHD